MKINLVDKCKANHTVTVPREYLEELETFYKEIMEHRFNMRGDLKKVKTFIGEEMILFITDNDIKTDKIIIVDDEGRERGKFVNPHF